MLPLAALTRGDATQAPAGGASGQPVRFVATAVTIDAYMQPLAAWQVHVQPQGDAVGRVRIVGIEAPSDGPFPDPYYDPAALEREQVILAAFTLASAHELPVGPAQVAVIHLAVDGPFDLAHDLGVTLQIAADPRGVPIGATATLAPGTSDHAASGD